VSRASGWGRTHLYRWCEPVEEAGRRRRFPLHEHLLILRVPERERPDDPTQHEAGDLWLVAQVRLPLLGPLLERGAELVDVRRVAVRRPQLDVELRDLRFALPDLWRQRLGGHARGGEVQQVTDLCAQAVALGRVSCATVTQTPELKLRSSRFFKKAHT
jgi:hypothetical protein